MTHDVLVVARERVQTGASGAKVTGATAAGELFLSLGLPVFSFAAWVKLFSSYYSCVNCIYLLCITVIYWMHVTDAFDCRRPGHALFTIGSRRASR